MVQLLLCSVYWLTNSQPSIHSPNGLSFLCHWKQITILVNYSVWVRQWFRSAPAKQHLLMWSVAVPRVHAVQLGTDVSFSRLVSTARPILVCIQVYTEYSTELVHEFVCQMNHCTSSNWLVTSDQCLNLSPVGCQLLFCCYLFVWACMSVELANGLAEPFAGPIWSSQARHVFICRFQKIFHTTPKGIG